MNFRKKMNIENYIHLKWKLSLGFGFLVLICTITTSITIFWGERNRFENEQKNNLHSLCELIASNIDAERLEKISSEEDQYWIDLKKTLSVAYRKFNLGWLGIYKKENGKFKEIVDGSDFGESFCFGYPIFTISAEIEIALKGEFVLADVYEDLYGTWRSAFCPIKRRDGTVAAIIDISQDCAQLEKMREKILQKALLIMITGVLFGMAFANLFSKFLTVGLEKLMVGLKAVGAGDFNYRFPIVSRDEIGLLATKLNQMVRELQEKVRLSRFVSENVSNIVKSDSKDLILTGEERFVSVLFSDIRSFTTLSEKNSPSEMVAMLNSFLDVMTEIISRNGGVIDKFIGDAIMAVFYGVDDSLKAASPVLAALEMMEELRVYNQGRKAKGLFTIDIGIGIAFGPVIAGVIGSRHGRVEYTVIGDTVNLASRLEGMSKQGKHKKIIISESLFKKIGDSFEVEEMSVTHVKGKEQTIAMYEIMGIKDVEGYISELNSADEETRLAAINFLRFSERKELLTVFGELFMDPSPKIRIGIGKAIRNLVKFGDEAVNCFKEALGRESDGKVLATLIMDYGRIANDNDLLELVKFLDHPEDRVRANSVEILGKCQDFNLLQKVLSPKLLDKNSRARSNAAFLLYQSGKIDGLRTLIEMCEDKANPAMRVSGAWGFGEIAELERKKMNDLHESDGVIEDNDYESEKELILGRARIVLESMLEDRHEEVVRGAAISLGRIKNRASLIPLTKVIGRFSTDDPLHQTILRAITEITHG
ncbi:MAG: HAMP domain-containing protein [Candidatus Riflebacteria bacterium]|nr:HAMP domain-containing protein [Candidatus Riflebacteria bacterium]